MTLRQLTLCVCTLILSVTGGCSGDAEKAVLMRKTCLSQLGLAYHAFHAQHDRSPSSSEELAKYIEASSDGEIATESAKRLRAGDIMMFWDVALKAGGDENEQYLLGFEATVPRGGGYIVTAGGSVELITAKKFTEYKELPAASSTVTPP